MLTGITLFKRLSNSSNKNFILKSAKENPPENCGYALRIFNLNLEEEVLEIRNMKKHIETKIDLRDIKRIVLNSESKKMVEKLLSLLNSVIPVNKGNI